MAETPVIARPRAPDSSSADRQAILAWHFGWLAAVGATLAGLAVGLGSVPLPIAGALALAASPALAALGLIIKDGVKARSLLLVYWAIAGAGACGLAGGVAGPLAVWCLAPLAAAALLGPGRLMAEAAALSVLGASVAALAHAAGVWPPAPSGALNFALGLVSLATLSLALAAALVVSRRRDDEADAAHGRARQELERLLTEQPDLIAAFEPDGRVTSAFGFAPQGLAEARFLAEGVVGSAQDLDRPKIRDAFAEALECGRSEVVFTPAGGDARFIALSLRVGADRRLMGVLRDVTRQINREGALEASKAEAEALNTGKSRFLANMSHELRTPLNTIMGFSDIMKTRLFGPLPSKYAEYADLIHESGRHLLDLINDLLDMSKIEAERFELQIEHVDARESVSAALRLMRLQADDSGVSMRAALAPAPLDLEADPRALKQMVLNLVSNALKFTPKGGQVTVSLSGQGETVELVVADTGVGIAPEDLKRIGRPYEQAGDASQRARGTGLGLSLVRAFAELHGGEMIIESALGEGTSVTVRLPGLLPRPLNAGPFEERPTAKVIAFNPQR